MEDSLKQQVKLIIDSQDTRMNRNEEWNRGHLSLSSDIQQRVKLRTVESYRGVTIESWPITRHKLSH